MEYVSKYLMAATVSGVLFAGCNRCQECTVNNNTETICETEFDNSQQYEDAIADREAAGATCTSSGGF
ncbi:MAG: hypothetical protein GC178_11500 [Flavobacteriales bacterium]|nr:hypothetical protein [Flavobacteriales bacterium]